MAYGGFKDLVKITASDKVLRNKTFNIAKILNIMDIKAVLLLWFTILWQKSAGSGVTTLANNERPLDLATQQLAEELHISITKKF